MHFKTETIVGLFILVASGALFYMSSQLGSFHFDLARYAPYTVSFKDAAGLLPKADVKVAGVKVGWVESVDLVPHDMTVRVTFKVLRTLMLYQDASAIVRQEGLLGARFLELVPGTTKPFLKPHDSLALQTRQNVSLDELFYDFKRISKTIEHIGTSSQEISVHIKTVLAELKKSVKSANELLAHIGKSTGTCAESFTETAQSLRDAAVKAQEILDIAQEPVKQIGSVAQKIQRGESSLGKFLSDTSTFDDLSYSAQTARTCLQRIRRCAAGIDTHLEILPVKHETNVKGYFDIWLAPHPNLFCIIGPVYSRLGFAKRTKELCSSDCVGHIGLKRDNFRLNLQLGACLPYRLFLRAGLFQGTAGFGIDLWLPFDRWRWVTSFEAFDFGGHTRFDCDRRPYLKWINRLYFSQYGYLAFGANDFISKRFKSGFIGFGASFSTCDWWPIG